MHAVLARWPTPLALSCAAIDGFELQPSLIDDSGDWVVRLDSGARWVVPHKPELVQLESPLPLPELVRRWASRVGVEAVSRHEGRLVLIVGPGFEDFG